MKITCNLTNSEIDSRIDTPACRDGRSMPDAEKARKELLDERLKNLAEGQMATNVRVDKLTEKLIDPPDGLFMRVQELGQSTITAHDKVDSVKSDLDKLVDVCAKLGEQGARTQEWMIDHEERDEELRTHVQTIAQSIQPLNKDYDRRMGIKKWTDIVVKAVLLALVAGAIPVFKAVFVDHDHDSEAKTLKHIESMLEARERETEVHGDVSVNQD